MAFVVAAVWRAKKGEEDVIREVLEIMTPLNRAEEGCLMFVPHESVDDPRLFFLYEQFVDESAFKAHTETEHYREQVLGRAVPRLEIRERVHYTTIDIPSDL
jgi:quinol monooxygenase YgiN